MTQENSWIVKNFTKLVNRYGGECIAVVKNQVVAVAKNEQKAEAIARKKYPGRLPSVLRVPRPKELVCVLSFRTQLTKA